MNFINKVVVVTGAAKGIGRGIASAYAENGAKVLIADVDETAGRQAESELKQMGADVLYIKTDVKSEVDIINLMETAKKTYDRIDVLINNAGKGLFKSLYEVTVDEWDDIIQTNLRSVFLCSREAAKYMRENEEGGAIINMASTRAIMSEPNSEGYAATKGGIVAITHALAASLSEDQITVNAISPGWIHTGDYSQLTDIDHHQHFSKRVGKPDDIARACLYLTDRENNFVTGINLVVDGGMTKKMIYEE
ncbi:NAD(P)-dependent dehydrogenase (short-subunit alcohol dehydrogenase family) [Neobacillus niacini]|jgi:NAD(P)-dependent dehydrogenase (short-subunit alcohol dehydrogenase family)|uniref:glucose 1-dehydrogenase n=1 Tax=Neobacillus niacini TaxID=86668 RepID=UPI00277E5547|nr:glucose 1-dehydrogenase [Neobacillus niacini]MDQ1001084.1 NAD(P)-dependent dehydrogenase (short-subunit alcohol dehydrogenase family) [Neobacillus niacini]